MKYKELPDEVCETLLIELFQSIPELLQQVAPDGFSHSQLVQVYHPLPQQQYKEYRHSQLQLISLQRRLKKPVTAEPTKSYEAFLHNLETTPVDEQYEMVSIFGDCLWNIFSNNHTVFNQNGEAYDIGSWRGSGRSIADVINKLNLVPGKSFDYLDFYMGHFITEDRADLTPVYEFIFSRLKAKGLDWEYSFPRMGLINFNKGEDNDETPETYDPAASMQKQLEQQQKQEEINSLQQKLNDTYNEEFEKARYSKPSQEVMAYYNVYGHWPIGHPLNENE
jgi:hypothetical protein